MRSAIKLLSGLLMLLLVPGCGPHGWRQEQRAPGGSAQIFAGMGQHHRPVSTTSAKAQQYFDQALVWTFAFNHDEAIRSYEEAARLDPNLAIAWWGVALCHGPHINNPILPEERAKAAWAALQKAQALKGKASPTERMLIDAVAARYADPPPADRRALDEAYAAAMQKVWQAHPEDADIGALYAESLMDLQPWDLWQKDGSPKGRALEIVAVLEQVLQKHPDHPGATHLYIHAVEASKAPQRAIAAADRLRDLVPAAGHLVHMPSHIDVRVGEWAKASRANELAIKADAAYRRRAPRPDFYHVYMAHNEHFLSFASMMQGRSKVATKAAHDMIAGVPQDWLKDHAALADGLMAIDLEVMKRFGRWDEILKAPAPPDYLPITTCHWRYIRGIAYAAKGDIRNARQEQLAFRERVGKLPDSAMYAVNPAKKVLSIADHLLEGEIALSEGRLDDSVSELRKGVAIEDDLVYMEPPEWLQPVRHTLGAVLLSAGRYAEAETTYREDLARWPENGWSLYGLAASLHGQGREGEAADVDKRFQKVWSQADVSIGSSCLCVTPGKR